MKTKDEIVANWLPRYTGTALKDFGKHILKESHWWRMAAPADQKLTPQTEEGIHEILWASTEKVKALAPLCYPSIRELLGTAGLLNPVS